jgi:hypothetical protein
MGRGDAPNGMKVSYCVTRSGAVEANTALVHLKLLGNLVRNAPQSQYIGATPSPGDAEPRESAFFLARFLRFLSGGTKMLFRIAGIDVRKRVLMVAVADASLSEGDLEFCVPKLRDVRRELRHLVAWLGQMGVREVVESTPDTGSRYSWLWKAISSNIWRRRGPTWPKGPKTDLQDAQRWSDGRWPGN